MIDVDCLICRWHTTRETLRAARATADHHHCSTSETPAQPAPEPVALLPAPASPPPPATPPVTAPARPLTRSATGEDPALLEGLLG